MAVIKNKIIMICWDPGSWKTMSTMFFVGFFYLCWYKRIYSNVNYYYRRKRINDPIYTINDINRIPFNEQKGLVIIDEAWLNINSRRSGSNVNLEYSKLGMLWRKKNVDIVLVAQLDYSIDKYFRDLAYATLYFTSRFVKKDYLMFEAKIYKKDYLIGMKEFDLFYMIKNTFLNYNTLEESNIDSSWYNEEQKKKKKSIKKAKKKKAKKEDIKKIESKILEHITWITA